jgi:hypothetical protein
MFSQDIDLLFRREVGSGFYVSISGSTSEPTLEPTYHQLFPFPPEGQQNILRDPSGPGGLDLIPRWRFVLQ